MVLKGQFEFDICVSNFTFENNTFCFYLAEESADNGDSAKITHKTSQLCHCPACTIPSKKYVTNLEFFSYHILLQYKRVNSFTCLKIFLDALKEGKTWNNAQEEARKLGYIDSPSPRIISYIQRALLYFKSCDYKQVIEFALQAYSKLLSKIDILHNSMGHQKELLEALVQNNWYDQSQFDRISQDQVGVNRIKFQGRDVRKFILYFENWRSAKNNLLVEQSDLLETYHIRYREIYWIFYQSSGLQSQKEFQVYFEFAVFDLFTILQKFPDQFKIRSIYSHGHFHMTGDYSQTTLVGGCTEQGEQVNSRFKPITKICSNDIQNAFLHFFEKESINTEKFEKIENIQSELKKFIKETNYQFADFELEFPSDNRDCLAFLEILENRYQDNQDLFEIVKDELTITVKSKASVFMNNYLKTHNI